MTWSAMMRSLQREPAQRWGKSAEFLHSATHFRDLLLRERMRSDRSRSEFALVVFTLPAETASGIQFLMRLQSRLRATDHAGFMDGARVGVILWNTAAPGADEFLESISLICDGHPPAHELYVYPHHDAADDSNDSDRGGGLGDGPASAVATRPVKAVESLFVRPLPVWKRCVDVVGAVFGLIVLSPLLLATAIAIRLTSPGPIVFRQRRAGLGGKPFVMWKFRSMYQDAEARQAALRHLSEQDGPAFKIKNDPRITPIGRFIRKTSIDELPQLWNVLRGEMSLVGPRPLPVGESAQCSGWERRRLEVSPGLTCIWQVHGKSRVTFTEWMRMDLRYIRARSLVHDLWLVLQTVFGLLFRRSHQC